MNPITDIVAGIAAPVKDLISEFIQDKDKAAELAYKVSTMAAEHAHAETLAQIEVNKVEAASGSLFIGGWRPFVGWTCGLAYFFNFIVMPLLSFFLKIGGIEVAPPEISFAELAPVLFGMLGFGAMRSFDKKHGVAKG